MIFSGYAPHSSPLTNRGLPRQQAPVRASKRFGTSILPYPLPKPFLSIPHHSLLPSSLVSIPRSFLTR